MNPILAYIFTKAGVSNLINGLALSLTAKTFNSDEFIEDYQNDLKMVHNLEFIIPNLENKEVLLPFLVKLTEEVSDEELKLAMHRIETVIVKKGLPNLSNTGSYGPKFNILKYVLKTSIGHEFLHMASSFYDKLNNIWLCGFQRVKNGLIIGRGLNEGFTELLASRYYNKDGKVTSYTSLVHICEMLELFFPNETDMRKLYFSCDLPRFINRMKEYMSEAEVYNLLFEMDLEIKSLNPNKSKNIKSFLYNKFMDKCTDPDKIDKMNALAMKNGIFCQSILNKEKVEKKMSTTSVSEVLKKTASTYYRRAGAVAVASAMIISFNQYNDKVKTPANNAKILVDYCTEEDAFILNEEMLLTDQSTKRPIDSYNGKYLYKSIVEKNLKYCDILDEFYTLNGGEITFNTYQAVRKFYYSEAEPIYAGGMIAAYAYYPNPDLAASTKYEIIDGKVYYLEEKLFKETIFPDGTKSIEVDDEELNSYDYVDLIDSQSYTSKPFSDIKDYNLLCDAEKVPYVFSDGHEETQWDIEYKLENKKN